MVRTASGFTLIELIMVIVLIGVLAVVAAPRLGDQAVYDLDRAGVDLVEAIRYTQEQSMTHSGAPAFQIAISSSGFTVTQSGAAINNPLDGSAAYTSSAAEWSGVSVASTETIRFDSRGKPACNTPCSEPGDSSVNLTLNKGGNNLTITIEKFTGYAHRL